MTCTGNVYRLLAEGSVSLLRCLGYAVRYYISEPAIGTRTIDESTLDLPILNIKHRAVRPGGGAQTGESAGASVSLLISILHASDLAVKTVYSLLFLGPPGNTEVQRLPPN